MTQPNPILQSNLPGQTIGDWANPTASATPQPQYPAVASGALTVPSIEAYGHSWVAGYGTTASKYGFVERLAQMLGNAAVHKVALGGGDVAGLAASGGVASLLQNGLATDLAGGPYIAAGGLKLCDIGFNDAAIYAAIANGSLLVQNALTLAYSRLLAAMIIPALVAGPALNNAQLAYSAGWTATADATLSIPPGLAYTNTSGAYAQWTTDTAYNSEPVTIVIPMNDGGCTVTVTVNGQQVAQLNTQTFWNVLAAGGVAGATLCIRLPAGTVPPGAGNTIRATYTAMGANLVEFGGVIIEPAPGIAPPLLIPNYPLLEGNAPVLTQAPWSNKQNQAAIAGAGPAALGIAGGGFRSATYIDLMPAMSPNYPSPIDTQYWSTVQQGHPNNLGYGRCANTLITAVRQALTAPLAAQMN